MIYAAVILIPVVAILAYIVGFKIHGDAVEKEISVLRNNNVLVEARHHSYIPMFIDINVSADKFVAYSIEAEAENIAKKEASKLQNRIDRVMWWSEFMDKTFNAEVQKLKSTCKTHEAQKYIDSMKPKNFSVLVITKTCPETKQSLSKSYTAVMVQQMIDKQSVEVPKRFTVTSPKVRYETMKHDNFTCTRCGRSGLDVELHVMPDGDELITVCKDCYSELLGEHEKSK